MIAFLTDQLSISPILGHLGLSPSRRSDSRPSSACAKRKSYGSTKLWHTRARSAAASCCSPSERQGAESPLRLGFRQTLATDGLETK